MLFGLCSSINSSPNDYCPYCAILLFSSYIRGSIIIYIYTEYIIYHTDTKSSGHKKRNNNNNN